MLSAYPSSYSFFDSTSDSIRAEDVDICRSSASFSSLADLFTNPTSNSALFPNVRAPIVVQEEVHFPTKKKRECEERTSIWHEWGSGECQTENVAQESSGFLFDLIKPSGKSSELCSSISPSSASFPNLGSANISVVTDEFSFPARKKREDGSWREERTSWQDWSMNGSAKENAPTETSTPVGSIAELVPGKPSSKPLTMLSSSKSSLFSKGGGGAQAGGTSDELSFPARKKREERSVWQECSMDGVAPSDCHKIATPRKSTSGMSSLADMYLAKPGTKCSGLFSDRSVSQTEEVVFPKRKNRADRNAWRDWTNTGYDDWEDDTHQEISDADNLTGSISTGTSESSEVLARSQLGSLSSYAGPSINEDSTGTPEEFSTVENLPAPHWMMTSAADDKSNEAGDLAQSLDPTNPAQALETVSGPSDSHLGNVRESGSSDFTGVDAESSRFLHSQLREEVERTMDGGESSDASSEFESEIESETEAGVHVMSRFQNARRHQRSRQTAKYPPPLGSLSRQGSLRVPHYMPWVQLQPIRTKGRFVLQEVKVTQPVVFQPTRRAGRLVLQLIGQENGVHEGEMPTKFEDRPVAEAKISLLPKKMDSTEPVTMDAALKRGAGRMEVRQPSGSLERRKRSAKVFPTFEMSQMPEGEGKGVSAVSTANATGKRNLKLVNCQELCTTVETISSCDSIVRETERARGFEEGFIQSSRYMSKVSPEDMKFDVRGWLHSDAGFRDKFSLSASTEVPEHLGQKGNTLTFSRAKENGPLRAPFQALPRTHSLRSGLSGLAGSRVEGEASLAMSLGIRNSSVCDFATTERAEDERSSSAREAALNLKPSLSVYQGIFRDTVLSLTTAPLFLRYLRAKTDHPGESDPALSNYAHFVAAAFSCADGMGKGHHENFWEQQPCVS